MFVGIPLPTDSAAWLTHAVRRLPLHEEEFRRSRRESWHITLQFLGNVVATQYECLVSRLSDVAFDEARIRIAGIGWIGAGILAAEIESFPELAQLARNVVEATKPCGFQPEERPWRPHVTLARRKRNVRGSRASLLHIQKLLEGPAPNSESVAHEFFLYESFTDPEGSRYEIRARFPSENSGG